MVECVVCGDTVSVSDACIHCAAPVCADHRETHDCPGVESDSAAWYTDPDAGRASARGGRDLSNPRRLAVGVGVVVAFALAAALGLAVADETAGFDDERVEQLVAKEVNDARTARGYAPLAANDSLGQVADAHSADMATREYVNHTAPNGSTVRDRLARVGIDCFGGENIYYTPNGELLVTEQAFAERVVTEWLRSPGHRETLLASRYTEQGIGIVVANDGGIYVTQNVC